jgi:hypothetical protein
MCYRTGKIVTGFLANPVAGKRGQANPVLEEHIWSEDTAQMGVAGKPTRRLADAAAHQDIQQHGWVAGHTDMTFTLMSAKNK